jgi:hypothetical protein
MLAASQTRGQGEVSGSPDPLGVVAQNAKMDQEGFAQMPGVQATYLINQPIKSIIVYHSLLNSIIQLTYKAMNLSTGSSYPISRRPFV